MFAGLPGTGIGAIFYLILTIWMPVREGWLLMRGESSAERWRFIAGRWGIFAAVLFVLWLQVRLLARIFPAGAPTGVTGVVEAVGLKADASSGGGAGVLLGTSLYAALVLLGVVGFVHLIRLALWYRARFDELAYQEDLSGEWRRFKRHIAERSVEVAMAAETVWDRSRTLMRRQTPRYR